ncbi:hypothetical protein [Streptomyces virginiae]|uniref:hypothetical protein n=1 Tax=Streptomyces virginiae TaxID=1961 RepID=UPI002E34E7A4|nr:hypothetical protein [Streptomyces virginiae]
MGVHGGVQIGHELLELFQELWRVGGHRGIEAVGERAEELVRPFRSAVVAPVDSEMRSLSCLGGIARSSAD